MPDQWHYHDRPGHSVGAKGTCAGFDDPVKSCDPVTDPGGEGKYRCVHGAINTGGGGTKKLCFLATACTEYAGLPDDCVELQVMREFRDTYVAKLPEGPGLIENYYEVAPSIIDRIKGDAARDLIFSYMLSRLRTVVAMIQEGKRDEAHALYMTEYRRLRARYDM